MQAWVQDRFAWRRADEDDTIDAALMARWCCFMFVAGAGLAGAALLLRVLEGDHIEHGAPILAAIVGTAVLVGLVVIAGFDRLPSWAFHAASLGGIVMVALALRFGGAVGAALGPLYLWVVVFAFNFHPRRAAVAYTLLSGVAYAASFLGGHAAPDGLEQAVVLVGVLAVAGLMIERLRTRRERLIARLSDLGWRDHLTELPNGRAYEHLLIAEVQRSGRTGAPLALLLMDLDGLREINRTLGEEAGDRVLRLVAATVWETQRSFDFTARIAAGRFAVLLPESDKNQGLLVAERLRRHVAEALARRGLPGTLSVGVAAYPQDGAGAEALGRAARRALAAAKKLGRDRTVVHSDGLDEVLDPEPDARAHLATVLALAEALDLRDRSTSAHSRTVGQYAERMAEALGLPPEHVERVRLAGLLHDIGKIAVPDAILHKPGKLSDAEWEEMRKHPETGARLLGHPGLQDIRAWVLAHHERPDGHGYPQGLETAQIPLEARILSVADAYEAMTADRCYRRAMSGEDARAELERCAGTQFDARVVAAFLGALDRERARASV